MQRQSTMPAHLLHENSPEVMCETLVEFLSTYTTSTS
jgi:hypothetical protein